jgi:hypothetical protein
VPSFLNLLTASSALCWRRPGIFISFTVGYHKVQALRGHLCQNIKFWIHRECAHLELTSFIQSHILSHSSIP